MMEVNIPGVVRELTSAFEAYERALQANDIEGLNALFWDSPHTLRYGVKELLYSHAEIARFRRERRQSQTWVRTDEGWKIVSAHVSFLAE